LLRSTIRLVGERFVSFPVVSDVRDIVVTFALKESRDRLPGTEDGTALSVKLTGKDPPPPPPQFTVQGTFKPLQEVRAKIAEIPRIRSARFEFMQTPHINSKRLIGRARWLGNPRTEF
jgi:hypothetical protein